MAMVKGPSYYDPRRHPKRAMTRRNLVLDMFHNAGFLEDKGWKAAKSAARRDGRSVRSTSQYPAFIDLVRRQLHGQYKDEDLTEDGLRIFTTLDPTVQAAAEQRVNKGLADIEKATADQGRQPAIRRGGHQCRRRACTGTRGRPQPGYAGFNRALDARRPIGSLVKPVVYLTALSQPSKYNVITPLDDSSAGGQAAQWQDLAAAELLPLTAMATTCRCTTRWSIAITWPVPGWRCRWASRT